MSDAPKPRHNQPRSLGNIARSVIRQLLPLLAANQNVYFDVSADILADTPEAKKRAIERLRNMSTRNLVITQALTLLLAEQQHDAELVILESDLPED